MELGKGLGRSARICDPVMARTARACPATSPEWRERPSGPASVVPDTQHVSPTTIARLYPAADSHGPPNEISRLFYDSLVRGGYLAVGKRESLLYCPDRDHYEQVRDGVNLFRKIRW